jgi:uncharacterized protein (TIGR02145 family)
MDVDSNVYKTVKIGTQTWMAENLKTTKGSDGSSLPIVMNASEWASLTSGAYCYYDNSVGNGHTYGLLYNFYAIAGVGNICPSGWHVSTNEDWETLTSFLGDAGSCGGMLKEAGLAHWSPPNEGASNSTGFTALPGGARYYTGEFSNPPGSAGNWWTSTEESSTKAVFWGMGSYGINMDFNSYNKRGGMSVRCVKD